MAERRHTKRAPQQSEQHKANMHHNGLETTAMLDGRDMDTRPRRFTARELKKVGVTLEDTQRHLLRCDQCGTGWVPPVQRFFRRPGARFRGGYWWCPKGCNHHREERAAVRQRA